MFYEVLINSNSNVVSRRENFFLNCKIVGGGGFMFICVFRYKGYWYRVVLGKRSFFSFE